MLIHFISFLFTSDKDKSFNKKDGNCTKETGECNCNDCRESQQQMFDERTRECLVNLNRFFKKKSERLERNKHIDEENKGQQQVNEGLLRWLLRNFFTMILNIMDMVETNEDSEDSEET